MSGQFFGKMRNCEISTVQYIETQIDLSWTDINVVKGYPNFNKQAPPVISVTLDSNNPTRREIGSTTMNDTYNILVDVFATSNGFRLDLAQFLQDLLKSNWTYYEYSQASGGSGTLDRTANGKVNFVGFTQNARIQFSSDVEFYDRYRHIIGVDVRVD